MRIAVLADIHGNVFALRAVLRDMARRGAGRVLNLGDILYGPIAPRETYTLLREHDAIAICGNQDRTLFEAPSEEIDSNPTLRYVMEELGEEALGWLASLPRELQLDGGVYLCHGAPSNDMTYLLEDIETGVPRLRPESEILELIDGVSVGLIVCGHTHVPRTVALSSGQIIVNPGSVGLPAYMDDEPVPHCMENHSPHASYAMVEHTVAGWTVEHIRVAYDHEEAARAASRCGRDDWAHYLRTGRGL